MADQFRAPGLMDQLFYYYFSEKESCDITLTLELNSMVDGAVLKRALNQAMERIRSFREIPVIGPDGRILLVRNEKDAEVYPYNPLPVNYGTEEVNGYLFRVMYEDNRIVVIAFHSLCDGRGMMYFARTLLYYYFTFQGVWITPSDQILTEEIPEDPTEMADSIRYFHNPEAGFPVPRKLHPVFRMPVLSGPVDKCPLQRRIQLIIDTKSFSDACHEAGTTFTALFSVLAAKAFHEMFDMDGRMLTMNGAIDLRTLYGSRSLLNFTDLFWMNFIPELLKEEPAVQARILKDHVMARQNTKEAFDKVLNEGILWREEAFSGKITDTEALAAIRMRAFSDPNFAATFFTTNVGKAELGPEMDPLVKWADIYVTCISINPYFCILSQGGKTVVNIIQRFAWDSLARKLCEVLCGYGIKTEYRDCGIFANDRLMIRNLRRLQ